MGDGGFGFCHKDIAEVLGLVRPSKTTSFLSNDAMQQKLMFDNDRFVFPQISTTNDLVHLAIQCDQLVYNDVKVEEEASTPSLWDESTFPFLLALADMGRKSSTGKESSSFSTYSTSAAVAAATLLALNGLESAIRTSTGFQTGRAPLLSTMISKIDKPANISSVFELLILPKNGGINLRNLLWHGFVVKLPRPWLALVLVTTWALLVENNSDPAETQLEKMSPKHPVTNLRSYPEFMKILDSTTSLPDVLKNASITKSIVEWLPDTHKDLFSLANTWILEKKRPASVCAILCVLLEHRLRLDWCRLNNRPDDAIARPEVFYVTLDGHGQRNVLKHDLLLHPYLLGDGDYCPPNLLVRDHLNGSTAALLMDLFCSSAGPNIRATVSHGLWDFYLTREWISRVDTETSPSAEDDKNEAAHWDIVRTILITMELAASKNGDKVIDYFPMFSFTAVARQNLSKVKSSLYLLQQIHQSDDYQHFAALSLGTFGAPPLEINMLKVSDGNINDKRLPEMLTGSAASPWTSTSVYREHTLNQQLADSVATRVLLQDIAVAANDHIQKLTESLELLKDDGHETTSKRKRKTALRVVHSSYLALALYTFTAHVAMLSLEKDTGLTSSVDPKLMLKAIERSRMVVSTVGNFLHDKVDRAIKSTREYTKGKAIKAVVVALSSIDD